MRGRRVHCPSLHAMRRRFRHRPCSNGSNASIGQQSLSQLECCSLSGEESHERCEVLSGASLMTMVGRMTCLVVAYESAAYVGDEYRNREAPNCLGAFGDQVTGRRGQRVQKAFCTPHYRSITCSTFTLRLELPSALWSYARER
jgi:hypothetical protein